MHQWLPPAVCPLGRPLPNMPTCVAKSAPVCWLALAHSVRFGASTWSGTGRGKERVSSSDKAVGQARFDDNFVPCRAVDVFSRHRNAVPWTMERGVLA